MINNSASWAGSSLSTIPFVSFAWAIRRHFICPGPMPRAMLALSAFSAATYVSFLVLLSQRTTPPFVLGIAAGQALFCLATMVFWWAIGETSTAKLRIAYQPGGATDIVSTGPYAWVRHPFYLAYMLFWLGTALIAGGWQWLPVLILIVWYHTIARSEERHLKLFDYPTSYAVYRQKTGMFFPSIWRQSP